MKIETKFKKGNYVETKDGRKLVLIKHRPNGRWGNWIAVPPIENNMEEEKTNYINDEDIKCVIKENALKFDIEALRDKMCKVYMVDDYIQDVAFDDRMDWSISNFMSMMRSKFVGDWWSVVEGCGLLEEYEFPREERGKIYKTPRGFERFLEAEHRKITKIYNEAKEQIKDGVFDI